MKLKLRLFFEKYQKILFVICSLLAIASIVTLIVAHAAMRHRSSHVSLSIASFSVLCFAYLLLAAMSYFTMTKPKTLNN